MVASCKARFTDPLHYHLLFLSQSKLTFVIRFIRLQPFYIHDFKDMYILSQNSHTYIAINRISTIPFWTIQKGLVYDGRLCCLQVIWRYQRGKSKAVKRIRRDNAMAKKKDDKTTNNKLLSTRHDTENTRLSNTNY